MHLFWFKKISWPKHSYHADLRLTGAGAWLLSRGAHAPSRRVAPRHGVHVVTWMHGSQALVHALLRRSARCHTWVHCHGATLLFNLYVWHAVMCDHGTSMLEARSWDLGALRGGNWFESGQIKPHQCGSDQNIINPNLTCLLNRSKIQT